MKRFRTAREYHDSQLMGAEWLRDRDLRLTFRLDGHWTDAPVEVSVCFTGVRNRVDVDEKLRSLSEDASATGRRWLADVVGIVRDSNRSYLIDTSQGALSIDAAGFSET